MKAWNWYYNAGRHTRSDRTFRIGEIEVTYSGIRLTCPSQNKHMDIEMSDAELDKLISDLKYMKQYKANEP